MTLAARMDEMGGRGGWIAATVLGFILYWPVGLAFLILIAVVAFLALLFVLPQLIGGYKLWKERPGARTWGIIGSILSCLSFPLGTAAGVYGLWFLFGDVGKQYYLGGSPQYAFNVPPQPPPPSSWQ